MPSSFELDLMAEALSGYYDDEFPELMAQYRAKAAADPDAWRWSIDEANRRKRLMTDKLTPEQYFQRIKEDNQRCWLSHVMDGPQYQEMTVKAAKALAKEIHLSAMRFAQDYHVGMKIIEDRERKVTNVP